MTAPEGLTKQELDDLIQRLTQRQQESVNTLIPTRVVKDILQEQGLLDELLQENLGSSSKKLQPDAGNRRRSLSIAVWSIAALTVTGLATWGGYQLGHKVAKEKLENSSLLSEQNLNNKIESLEAEIANFKKQEREYQQQIQDKNSQIKELIDKIANPTIQPKPNATILPGGNGLPLPKPTDENFN
jgi:uncharacterized membrane-anchored protein YhcB (DUF1043 family)